jgi:peptidyl-prolyl cis-trans isomerase SurA
MKKYALIFCFVPLLCWAQKLEDKTLLTIDGAKYNAGTFLKVYQKNLDIVQDESQKDLDNYLQLYIDYRLKLKEAYESKLDTTTSYKEEIAKYRSSLAEGFLTDNEVSNELIEEAMKRSKEEVNASHILIMLDETASPEDTLKAWNRIHAIHDELVAGAKFAPTARIKSEGPSSKVGGELGWFGPFKMIYEFENKAYNTPVGEFTEPFRTSFGYHIVKVNDKRPARGYLTVAHIMTFDKPQDSIKTAEKRIKDIYAQLQDGKPFAELAREFSDDLNSAQNGGKLMKFTTGGINSPKFEDMAYGIEKENDYTEPFESKFGWHIIKLLRIHPPEKEALVRKRTEDKIKKAPRSRKITDAFTQKLADKYDYAFAKAIPQRILNKVNDSLLQGAWNYKADQTKDDEVILSIKNSRVSDAEFLEYVAKNQRKVKPAKTKGGLLNQLFYSFQQEQLINYYRDNLERDNADFAFLFSEFKEGILLFDLLQNKIWQKAKTDSIGQRDYFEKHRDRYRWTRRADLTIIQNTSDSVAQVVRKMLLKEIPMDTIKTKFNEDGRTRVIVSNGIVEENYSRLPKEYDLKLGVSEVYHSPKDSFHKIIVVTEILEPSLKTLDEARGAVINDYQQELEDEWENSLRDGHKIKVNQKVLAEIKRRF